MGIRNGIDVDIWDPENDDLLPRPYNADSVVEGKAAARETLRYRLGLTGWGDKPMVGVVTRLTEQKGAKLTPRASLHTISCLKLWEYCELMYLHGYEQKDARQQSVLMLDFSIRRIAVSPGARNHCCFPCLVLENMMLCSGVAATCMCLPLRCYSCGQTLECL